MKAKNKMTQFGIMLVLLMSFSSLQIFAATVTFDGSTDTKWNTPANWDTGNVPTAVDDVVIPTGKTCNIDVDAVAKSIDVTGILEPDASPARIITVEQNVTVSAGGEVHYRNTESLGTGTGRLSWVLEGTAGNNTIDNSGGADTDLQVFNITFNQTIVPAGAGQGSFYVYGNFDTGGGNFTASAGHGKVYMSADANGTAQTIDDPNGATFDDLEITGGSTVVSTIAEFTVVGTLTVAAGATLNMNSGCVVTMETDGESVVPTGTLTVASGATLKINGNTTITDDLAAFAGTLQVIATEELTVTGSKEISGTGAITTGAASKLIIEDADGVSGVFALTGANSIDVATDYQVISGSLGFAGLSIVTIDDLEIGSTSTDDQTITATESFTISGNFTMIDDATDGNNFTASSGTITMSGAAAAINTNDETIDFFGLNITGVGVTMAADQNIIVNNFLGTSGAGTLVIADATGDNNTITFDADATIFDATGSSIDISNDNNLFVTGTLTLLSNLAADGATGGGTEGISVSATGTVDFATFTFTGTNAAVVTTLSGATIKTAHALGVAGNIVSAAASVVHVGTNYEFNTSTCVDMGFDDFDGQGTDIVQMGNVVINGAEIAATGAGTEVALQIDGNLTVSSGFFKMGDALSIVTMCTSANATITNSTGTSANITFKGLELGAANTLTVSGDITLDAATDLLEFAVGAGTFDCTTNDAHVYIIGAGDINSTGVGTYNFHDLTINGATAVTINAANINMNIEGGLTLDNAGGSLIGATLSSVDFNGAAAQTIETTGGTVSLDLVTISNAVGVTTDDDMTFSVAAGAVVLSGKFTATAGTVTFGATTAGLNVSGNSSTFFNVATGLALTAAGNWGIINDLTGASLSVGGTLTFFGDPTDLDANVPLIGTGVGDSKQIATAASVLLLGAGNITVSTNCELQRALIIGNTGTITVDGRLELTATVAKMAGGTIDMSSGGTIHLSGVNLTDLTDAAGTVTLGTSANAILDGDQVTVASAVATLNNLILSSTAEILMEATTLTIHGTIENEGLAMTNAGDDASIIVLAGATPHIGGTTAIAVGTLTVNAASGTNAATCDGDIIILNAAAANFNVTSGDSFIASAGTITFDDDDGAALANIVNSNTTDETMLVFHDLALAATATNLNVNTAFTISGSLSLNAAATMIAGTSGPVTFTGTAETVTVTADDGLSFDNVNIAGGINFTGDFETIVTGDFTVTSAGAFTMTNGEIEFNDTGNANHTITNNGACQFHDFQVNETAADDTLKIASSITINGDIVHTQGTFYGEDGTTITLDLAAAQAVTSAIDDNDQLVFDNLTVDGNGVATRTINDDIKITGNLTVTANGILASGAILDEIYFNSGDTKTITNNGTLTLGRTHIENIASNAVTTASSFNLLEDLRVDGTTGGTFEATAGTITMTGNGAIDNGNTGDATALKLFNLTVPTGVAATYPASKEFYINGDLTIAGTGTLVGNTTASKVWFAGSNEQTISLGSAATAFSPFNMTLNNSNGLKLVSTNTNITEDQFDVTGVLRVQSGDLDLNGNNIITFDVDGSATSALSETSGNTVVNSGVSASTGHLVGKATLGIVSNSNVAGLGARVTGTAALGLTTVRRYHTERTIGGDVQATRYYGITSANGSLGGKVAIQYDESELGALTEADLILLRTTDETNGPWFQEPATLNTILNRITSEVSSVAQFTADYEFWTVGTPDVLSATVISSTLADNPLAAGSLNNAIFGVQYTSSGATIDITDVQFNLGRNLAATVDFSDFDLVYSSDDDYSTTADNVSLLSGTNATAGIDALTGTSFVKFDLDGQSVNSSYVQVSQGSPVNYFLIVDPIVSLTANTSTITPAMTETEVDVTGGVVAPFTLTGTAYSFLPSIEVVENFTGVSQGPLVIGQDDNAIFGFKAQLTSVTGLPGFTGFTLKFNDDPSAVFDNVKFYVSTSEDFGTVADRTEIALTTETIGSSSIIFGFVEQKLNASGTPKYYFVSADVKTTIDASVSNITPRLVFADITSTNAGIRGTDLDGNALDSVSGYNYDFFNSTVTISNASNMAASDLGRNFNKQPIFGFTVTPDDGQSIEFNSITVHAALTNAYYLNFDKWELYEDTNNDGYGSVRVSIGTMDSSSAKGNLKFMINGANTTLSSATNYIVTVKPKSTATASGTVGVYIPDENYVSISSPASVNAGGPFPSTTIVHTVRANGTATKLAFVPGYDSTVVSGSAQSLVCRLVDANGYPTTSSAATAITIAKVSGTGTIAGATGTILANTNAIAIAPTFTTASTDLLLNITDDAAVLTASDNSSSFTIYAAAPAVNNGLITFFDAGITAVKIPISQIDAATGLGGGNKIVVMRQGFAPANPTNGVDYTANVDISSAGDVGVGQTGAGSYVLYDGNANGLISLNIVGLIPDTRYYFKIFEYNGSGSTTSYITSSAFTSETNKNPITKKTATGSITGISDSTTAANIPTDIDVAGNVSSVSDIDWYKFNVPSTKNNILLRISNLTANCTVELYDNSGNDVTNLALLRQSQVTTTGDEVLILNGLSNGPYMLKVYPADTSSTTSFTTATYTVRINTSANEILSVTN